MNQPPRISVCIATYKRPERLHGVLADLQAQTLRPSQVVVVDNDAARSAEPVALRWQALPAAERSFELVYGTQLERNISLTRNRTVALADGDWLAFIDDDERAPPGWLQGLLAAAAQYQADGVLAPVLPVLPEQAPAWIRRGSFYDFPRMSSGTQVPLNQLRFGNLVLRGTLVRAEPGPFDPNFGLSTGEDADMLLRLIARGGRIVWCDEACVSEPVEPARLSLRWLMQRVYSGGQEYARKALSGCYGPMGWPQRLSLLADVLAKLVLALLLVPLSLPAGRHRAAHWLLRAQANLGKLSAFAGHRYQEYRKASVAR
jgi:succinoglycan biosynthesis protein ExoM